MADRLCSASIASRLVSLAAAHGAPNHFQLHEVAGSTSPSDVLAVSWVARFDLSSVNQALKNSGLQASYVFRRGDSPACISLSGSLSEDASA